MCLCVCMFLMSSYTIVSSQLRKYRGVKEQVLRLLRLRGGEWQGTDQSVAGSKLVVWGSGQSKATLSNLTVSHVLTMNLFH